MKIGKVDLGERPLLLAPMEDVTDVAFRLLCKRFGADMVYTEFLSADALIRQVAGTTRKLEIDPEERPVAIQIYGREVEPMVEAARISEAAGPEVLDLNFGCPVKRVAGKGAGSGMLRCPDQMLRIVEEVVKAVKIPVTVKTRLGWDNDSKIIVTLAEALQDVGIQALTIHGRTRAQMYTGQADWTLIGAVKDNHRQRGYHYRRRGSTCLRSLRRRWGDGRPCYHRSALDLRADEALPPYGAKATPTS